MDRGRPRWDEILPREGPPMERRDRLSRRQFVVGAGAASLGLLVGCGRWPGQTQSPAKVPRIGYLMPRSGPIDFDRAFAEALHDLGYVEGHNVAIEWRFFFGQG